MAWEIKYPQNLKIEIKKYPKCKIMLSSKYLSYITSRLNLMSFTLVRDQPTFIL